MSKRAYIGAVVTAAALAALAQPLGALQVESVVRGNEVEVSHQGQTYRLMLAGVWVPAPPGQGEAPQYQGSEARHFVAKLLAEQDVVVQLLGPLDPSAPVPVRIRLRDAGRDDLAVLLAQAGLALAEPTSAADPEQASAIRQAERSARRDYRGMHDGGFLAFANSQGRTVDFGTIFVSTFHLRRIGDRAAEYNADRAARQAAVEEAQSRVVHRHAVQAIHDWGRRFDLPRDSSRLGH